MQDEKWEQLREHLKSKFRVESETLEDLVMETQDGLVKQGVAEVLIVETPMGKMKVARENRPVVLDKKFIYSHRAGQAGRTEYQFSDTEFSHKLKIYKWDDDEDEWSEIDPEKFISA